MNTLSRDTWLVFFGAMAGGYGATANYRGFVGAIGPTLVFVVFAVALRALLLKLFRASQ